MNGPMTGRTGVPLTIFKRGMIAWLVISGSACNGRDASLPTTPTSATQTSAPVQKVFTRISGGVADTAFRPLTGVRIEFLDGPQAGTSTETDADSAFSFSGTFTGVVTVRATKEGYVSATQALNLQLVCCSSDSAFIFFTLESAVPSVKIEPGDYSLTLIADNACGDLPADLRTRTYSATITRGSTLPSNTHYDVEVSGPLLSSFGFGIGVSGNYLGFVIDGPAFFEHIPPLTYLEIAGQGGTSVDTSILSTISIPFAGSFEYCVLNSEMNRTSNCYTTPPDQKIAYSQCLSNRDLMILTRR